MSERHARRSHARRLAPDGHPQVFDKFYGPYLSAVQYSRLRPSPMILPHFQLPIITLQLQSCVAAVDYTPQMLCPGKVYCGQHFQSRKLLLAEARFLHVKLRRKWQSHGVALQDRRRASRRHTDPHLVSVLSPSTLA